MRIRWWPKMSTDDRCTVLTNNNQWLILFYLSESLSAYKRFDWICIIYCFHYHWKRPEKINKYCNKVYSLKVNIPNYRTGEKLTEGRELIDTSKVRNRWSRVWYWKMKSKLICQLKKSFFRSLQSYHVSYQSKNKFITIPWKINERKMNTFKTRTKSNTLLLHNSFLTRYL